MKRALVLVAGLLLLLLIVASLPLKPHMAVPEWNVTVVDAHGAPVSGMKIDETWHDYTCKPGLSGYPCQRVTHEAHLLSDADGHARFPAVRDRRVFAKCVGGTSQQLDQMMSSGRGNFWSYAAFGGESVGLQVEERGYCVDWSGPKEGLTSKVVIPDKWLYGQPADAIR